MYDYRAVVERVVDGDTVRLTVDLGFDTWHTGCFRLLGLAARELDQPGGPEARDHLAELLPVGARVSVQSVKVDKYGGRYNAAVTLPGGTPLAGLLIDTGWAAPWSGRGVAPLPPWPRLPADVTG